MSTKEIFSQDDLKNKLDEEEADSINETKVICKDMKHFCLIRIDNPKKMSQIENEKNNSELNMSKIGRKDAKGESIIKRGENNKKLKHHVYFIDEVDNEKKLTNIIKVKCYKDYNKNAVFNSIYEENFRMQMVDHNCCCIIV